MEQEITRRFNRVDDQLAQVRQDMAGVLEWKDRVDGDLYNHGQDGLKTQFTKFMALHEGREQERQKSDSSFRFWLTVILSILTVMLTAVGLLEANRQIHERTGVLRILHSGNTEQNFARGNVVEDADMPKNP